MAISKSRMVQLRSPEAQSYHYLYNNRRWRKARLEHLTAHPLCVMCQALDRIKQATVVDHITPHRGNTDLFWDPENWQSLCDNCHSGHKQRDEAQGFSSAFDAQGYPIDPKHPANASGPSQTP
jgi:5-methylcytosine-specific restriction endonuclease McrA